MDFYQRAARKSRKEKTRRLKISEIMIFPKQHY
jgi:hypothetical protein